MIYRLLIVAATLIWGSSFVVVKDVTGYVTPAWILAFRFAVAALILALVFVKRRKLYFKKEYILYGGLFGIALFMGYYVQTCGLVYTTPGKNAFLTGTYCVMVPFLAWFVVHKRPTRYNLLAAGLCIVGVGMISLGSAEGSLNIGDLLTLCCAVFYAIHICIVARFSQGRDIMVLTMWQFAIAAVCAVAVGFVAEGVPTRYATLPMEQWVQMGYLAVFCTAMALLFQNIGQANIPPASASLLLSLESPFGVAFSVALGAEVLTGQMCIGFVLVFTAILISEWLPDFLANRKADRTHKKQE